MQNNYREVRNSFKTYFKMNEHSIVPSSNLVPKDPTLLFANSGMVQFKDIFTGAEKTNLKRATSVQKCIRAGGKHNDLENVGFTNRHHTFFEMLGNFSFGDYFKEEAIFFAWQFLTKELRISKDRLYITVYHEDLEAFNIWQKLTGFGEERIIKIKTNDNFWSMGPVGPCGPCSEIFYDYGPKVKGGLPGTAEQDGSRYTEIWNLVFMQFNQVDENTRIPLERKGIDTGMGLERLVSVLEEKVDNYKTSLFQEIIGYSKEVIGKVSKDDIAYRILSDHARSTAFLIADGVMPSSEGRGYVLRRIIRRALRHLYMIGYKGGDLHKITGKIIDLMGEDYPELEDARTLITSHTKQEEEKFMATLPTGMRFLENEMSVLSKTTGLEPKKAFMLYDTFGFPIDITNDVLASNGFPIVSEEAFEKEMLEQRKRSKESWKGSGDDVFSQDVINFASGFNETKFEGYEKVSGVGKILGILGDCIVLESTVFYPEGGGQVGDTGLINGIPVVDAIKVKGVILHKMASTAGLKVGLEVSLQVDEARRRGVMNAHSATHLLHHVLREKFGETVVQKGSLVQENELRFDFSLNRSLTHEEINEIEVSVNGEIAKSINSISELKTLEEAKKQGAMAFFGEKYGAEVRVLKIGKSVELCGGTHVSNTSSICAFKIIKEEAVGSGIRRVEAITGVKALNYLLYAGYNLEVLRSGFKMPVTSPEFLSNYSLKKDEALESVAELQAKLLKQTKELELQTLKLALKTEGVMFKEFYIKCVNDLSADVVKQMITNLKHKNEVLVIFAMNAGKGTFYVSSKTPESFSAVEVGKKLAAKFNAKGGGKPDFASFGGIPQELEEEEITKLL